MTGPNVVDHTGSSIQFLGDLIDSTRTFDNQQGGASAFRIRHDTVDGALIFQGRSGSYGPYELIRLNDDTNTVTFGGVVNFEDITFDQITGSYLYIGSGSKLLGTTSLCNIIADKTTQFYIDSNSNLIFQNQGFSFILDDLILSFSSSYYLQTASIWYDGTQMHIDGLKTGNSWKTQYKITTSYYSNSFYPIYTESIEQQIQHFQYLTVLLNGDALIQSSSIRQYQHWDYKRGDDNYSIKFRYNIPYSIQDQFYITYMYNGGTR